MNPAMMKNTFLVKEHVGMFKAANNYDIYDPATGGVVLHCREPKLGFFTKLLRFTDYKRMTPFDVRVTTPDGQPVVQVTRGTAFLRSRVKVLDEGGRHIGGFKQKLLSVGGAFEVMDTDDRVVCTLKGKWTGWDFTFMAGDKQVARVTKKWSGVGKELFTSADNYVLQIDEGVRPDSPLRPLIMASVMCIDMVLKE